MLVGVSDQKIGGKNLCVYCTVGTFEGENFHEFRSFVAIRESFLREIWERGVLWHSKSEQSTKVFSAKIGFLSRKFSTIHDMSYVVIDDVK